MVLEEGWGEMSRAVAKHRPHAPIAVLSESLKVCRQLSISRGVHPTWLDSDEDGIIDGISAEEACDIVSTKLGLLDPGDVAVVVIGDSISVETVGFWDEVDDDDEQKPYTRPEQRPV